MNINTMGFEDESSYNHEETNLLGSLFGGLFDALFCFFVALMLNNGDE